MHVEAVGVFCLGGFVGYLCWYFVVRIPQGKTSIESFASVVGVVAGGVVLEFLKTYIDPKSSVWWYPVGLIAGVLAYAIVSLVNRKTRRGETPPDEKGDVYPTALGVFKPVPTPAEAGSTWHGRASTGDGHGGIERRVSERRVTDRRQPKPHTGIHPPSSHGSTAPP